MRLPLLSLLALAGLASAAVEDFQVSTSHPRLFLTGHRLRLLQRERERRSPRWMQFEALVRGGAPMPEPGLTDALVWRVAGDREAGRRAVTWALGTGRDLRQLALVFDWCQDLFDESQSRTLAGKLRAGIAQTADARVPAVRARVLAAVALAGHAPDNSAAVLEQMATGWWEGRIVKALKRGEDALPPEDCYALFELLHAVRDNLTLDLRESDPDYFKDLANRRLLNYYPASYPAGENEYRIPAAAGTGEPDLRRAALARAADLSIVSYDLNSPGGQVLQGWLMHDRFQLRGPFGAPYEFLWANPYQPGLSYYHVPLVCHDRRFGRLFVRSTWDDNATWLGTVDGQVQLFRDGHVTVLDSKPSVTPLALTEALVFFGAGISRFKARTGEEEQAFVLGLKPGRKYQVEVDEEEVREESADRGGILPIDLPAKSETGFRLRELGQ